ncbi:MAG: A/G-specific adenine glycosylase [Rhodobacteraceae bacterium]|nr:A/G-specific adenine glycosylase [Paracoccaceae bacterium]
MPSSEVIPEIHLRLLSWYDSHGRDLSWRYRPGTNIRPDPYRVWLSEIMLQQTTVTVVERYFVKFLQTWPTVDALADADEADVLAAWAGLGYYTRARNLHRCARILVKDYGGVFPEHPSALKQLPGIGDYTAAAIAAIAHDYPVIAIDGNIERVLARLFAVETPLPTARKDLRRHAESLVSPIRSGDVVQALMDLGAMICRPVTPQCALCPCVPFCEAHALGRQSEFPVRKKRPGIPLRKGILYVGCREDGAWLLEKRPGNGLLGGLYGWPGCIWDRSPPGGPPCDGDWRTVGTAVHHGFTHFRAEIEVRTALLASGCTPARGAFVPAERFNPNALPVLMRKAFRAAEKQIAMMG